MGFLGMSSTNFGGGGAGDITINGMTDKNPITYLEVVRLNGNSATKDAMLYRDRVLDYAGVEILPAIEGAEGREFILSGVYKSWSVEILRESEQDAQFSIGEIGYKVGPGNITDTVTPRYSAEKGSYSTQVKVFKAEAGAFIEIYIERDNKTDQESP